MSEVRMCSEVEREAGKRVELGIRYYLEDRMYRWKAPHGGHSKDLSHQVSSQKMRLQLMKLEFRATDPAFGQEPDHWRIRGQEKGWRNRSDLWQLELKQRQGKVGRGAECQVPNHFPSLACYLSLPPPHLPVFLHLPPPATISPPTTLLLSIQSSALMLDKPQCAQPSAETEPSPASTSPFSSHNVDRNQTLHPTVLFRNLSLSLIFLHHLCTED